jgi:hypothetical protein
MYVRTLEEALMTDPSGDVPLFAEPVEAVGAESADPAADTSEPAASPGSGTSGRDTSDTVTPTPEKDPADWVTGDEPMTGPQQSYLSTLAQEAGREVPTGLNKAEASRLIDELQNETGRGR